MAATIEGTECKHERTSWGYGYAGSVRISLHGHTISELGSYLMCDDCCHVLQFTPDTDAIGTVIEGGD